MKRRLRKAGMALYHRWIHHKTRTSDDGILLSRTRSGTYLLEMGVESTAHRHCLLSVEITANGLQSIAQQAAEVLAERNTR